MRSHLGGATGWGQGCTRKVVMLTAAVALEPTYLLLRNRNHCEPQRLCRPLHPSLLAFGNFLKGMAMPYLVDSCKQHDINSCELLMYYHLFDSKIGRHRDQFTVRDYESYIQGRPVDKEQRWAQLAYSNILIWTFGNAPMHLLLSFKHKHLQGRQGVHPPPTPFPSHRYTNHCPDGILPSPSPPCNGMDRWKGGLPLPPPTHGQTYSRHFVRVHAN